MKKYFLIPVILILFLGSCEIEKPKPTFTLSTSVSPTEGGRITISPQSPIYNQGDIVMLTPESNEGWIFEKWEGDINATSIPLQIIINTNISVVGVFVKRKYQLNITIEGEGTVEERILSNSSGREYPHGSTVELTPKPKEGWEFVSWGGDLSGTETPQTITVDKERNVTVKFREISKFYLLENGITCMCPNTKPGDKGFIYGAEYESVDNYLLRKRRDEGIDMSKLCTSLVTDMSELFMGSSQNINTFNQPIGNWDVSNVTNMRHMFAFSLFNQPIGDWNVSKVTDMEGMFWMALFNQPIGDWNVSNVINMSLMFRLSPFNQPLGNWDVSNVTNMRLMFSDSPFNQPIGNWDVSSVTNMSWMFKESPFNLSIENWDVSKVTDMSSMFRFSQFNQPIGNWNVANVTNMEGLFFNSPFNQPIGNWNVSNVTNMRLMFMDSPFNQPIGNWDVSKVTFMGSMFSDSQFNQSLDNWDVSNVTEMNSMFWGSQFNLPLYKWNVSNVTDMGYMFRLSQFNQPIGNWDVSSVTNMRDMFRNSRFNQKISNWCVIKIISEPQNFSTQSPLTPENKPNWGTCPD